MTDEKEYGSKGGRGSHDLEQVIDNLKDRIKDLEAINESHKKLNGELRQELDDVRKTSTRVS
jgi:predicted RNase H-like nuclease (RuvC/YqgF family)|tara:strand:- start:258 stop:443 length:186 start_codon:yes stop_codon:yes gene_type:complete